MGASAAGVGSAVAEAKGAVTAGGKVVDFLICADGGYGCGVGSGGETLGCQGNGSGLVGDTGLGLGLGSGGSMNCDSATTGTTSAGARVSRPA